MIVQQVPRQAGPGGDHQGDGRRDRGRPSQAGAATVGVNAEDGSRTDDGVPDWSSPSRPGGGADRVRYCDTIGGDTPGGSASGSPGWPARSAIPVETHCHNDLGMAVANSVSGALGDLDAGQDAWVNTCVNGIGERAGNADLLSRILAFRHGFGVTGRVDLGDPSRPVAGRGRFALWAAYAFGQPLPHEPARASGTTRSRTSPASTPTAR